MNHLATESSPYLRQHADNPVDWYPWGDEAFERARREDRPVFLSIGYSACHWCHVMAHESFEDPAVAAELNAAFVAVKVDREERPDVDAVYMEAVQAVTGSGGWPMSVFLLPDGRPFYGGTYFPPEDRPGLPSFRTVVAALADAWTGQRAEVEAQATELADTVARRSTLGTEPGAQSFISRLQGADAPDLGLVAVEELRTRFDPEYGGFGPAPKFPQPSVLDALLRTARAGGPAATEAGTMALTTLTGLAAGGIHDHLGGGFARYSTDRTWLVPHFEKMLYDQAGLLRCFAHAFRLTGDPVHRQVMGGIVGYVTRDLRLPDGGLASAEDADSEGGEGRFATWTLEEVGETARRAGLDDDEAGELATFYGVVPGGNFEGRSVLHRPPGAPLRPPPASSLDRGRQALFLARQQRPRPGLDDKVLTEWNAMYASALVEAASAAGQPGWLGDAEAVVTFLLDHLRGEDGRWMRSWQADVGARHLAFAADYAWVVDACTRLAETTGRARWLAEATAAADGLCDLFLDEVGGGFHTTGGDAEALIVRTKDVLDGATPSANAVAAVALARLAALTGEDRHRRVAAGVVDLLGELLVRHPSAFPLTAHAGELLSGGTTEIVITGDRPDLLATVHDAWRPDAVLAWGEPTGSPLWTDRVPVEGAAGRAYVCRSGVCRLPVDDQDALAAELEATGA